MGPWLFFLAMTALAQPPAPPPTFRAGTKLVQVDVVVRDKKGPAAGLTKEDFTVFDNGKPQEISSFSVKSVQPSARPAVPLPPGAISNRLNPDGETPATQTILLIDQRSTPQTIQAYANQRIVKFLETRRKSDRMGIYALGKDGLQSVQELTDDIELLRRAANNLKPQNPIYSDCAGIAGRAATECGIAALTQRVTDTKHALEAIARHLTNVPGRKNLIWVTASFPLILVLPGQTVDFTPDMQEAALALNDAKVALYAVDARGLVANSGPGVMGLTIPGLDTMNFVTGITGGRAFYADNGLDDLIREAVEDAELTYTLGFYPALESKNNASKNQDVHNLKVKVSKPGLVARYRENYSSSDKVTAAKIDRPTMEQLLNDPLDATQVGLFAETTPDSAHPGRFNVRVSVDLRDVKLENQADSSVGAVDVSFHVEGSKGARVITRKIQIPAYQLAASLEKPLVVETSMALEGSTGVLRIVAQDQATGAAGSLRLPLGKK
jgi:VWFA-related protein